MRRLATGHIFLWLAFSGLSLPGEELTHFSEEGDDLAYAVGVNRGTLVYTRQFFAIDESRGKAMIEELSGIADACGATLQSVVRLNFFLADNSRERREQANALLLEFWPRGKTPAVTFIPGRLPDNAAMACDAVIHAAGVRRDMGSISSIAGVVHAKISPGACDLVYASGRVAKGASFQESIPTAMKLILHEYIFPLGCDSGDVLQIRAYVNDMERTAEARRVLEKFFETGSAPPMVFVEWAREDTVEIELIAAAPASKAAEETVRFYTPPNLRPSPAFSRVAIVRGEEIVFFGGVSGKTGLEPKEEVESLFQILEERVEEVGSDMSHLVKATYMVSDPDMDATFSEVRLRHLDPVRPPAASKVFRSSVDAEGRTLLIDMIATKPSR
jgi:enamine deaminase RidA (YjgF/YER057c/UK114 family)